MGEILDMNGEPAVVESESVGEDRIAHIEGIRDKARRKNNRVTRRPRRRIEDEALFDLPSRDEVASAPAPEPISLDAMMSQCDALRQAIRPFLSLPNVSLSKMEVSLNLPKGSLTLDESDVDTGSLLVAINAGSMDVETFAKLGKMGLLAWLALVVIPRSIIIYQAVKK